MSKNIAMCFGIKQPVFLQALAKGAMPALSDSAQTDTTNLSPLVKSVFISAGKILEITSNTNEMAIKYSLPISKENGVGVKDEGVVVVSAKELYDWTKIQESDATLNLVLETLDKVKSVNTSDDEDSEADSVNQVGNLKLLSKTPDKSQNSWELDTYDHDQLPALDFSNLGDLKFRISGSILKKAIKSIAFAANIKDKDHKYDNISFQSYKGDLYLLTTNTRFCAIYSPEAYKINLDEQIMIPLRLLAEIVGLLDDKDVDVYVESKSNKAFIKQDDCIVRFSLADASVSLPSVDMLITKSWQELALVQKSKFKQVLDAASLVNNRAAFLNFEKNNELSVTALSETGKRPTTAKTQLQKSTSGLKTVQSISHLKEMTKAFKHDMLEIYVDDKKSSIRIKTDEEEVGFFGLSLNPALYRPLMGE